MAFNNETALIQLKNITKRFTHNQGQVCALDRINLSIHSGEFLAITGASGSGKSTLLSILACLDIADEGEYLWDSKAIIYDDENALASYRQQLIGIVFQQYNLIPRLSALQNVELPMMYADIPAQERRQRASLALQAVGMREREHYSPAKLSGGEQQRVAIARALVNNPSLIVADEPTGALDEKNAQDIMQLFKELNRGGRTIVMVSHDRQIVQQASRVVILDHGKLIRDEVIR